MNHNFPPMQVLRAFEVAGRHLSFKRAAQELCLTPSAVSHQIKALEQHLGVMLFQRLNRSLLLTDAGRAYLPSVVKAMQHLRSGRETLHGHHQNNALQINLTPYVATEIVIPSLNSFYRQFPEIELCIETNASPLEIGSRHVDMAIQFGEGDWPNVVCEKLIALSATPVCAPAMAKQLDPQNFHSLTKQTLICSTQMPRAWQEWCTASCPDKPDLQPSANALWLDNYLAILQSAEQGLGLALGLLPLINPWLPNRRLVAPFAHHHPLTASFYLTYRDAGITAPMQAFRSWLLEHFSRLADAMHD